MTILKHLILNTPSWDYLVHTFKEAKNPINLSQYEINNSEFRKVNDPFLKQL